MVTKEHLLPYGRFKYAKPFTGSCEGMRYKIVHPKPSEGEENLIYVEVWPGPNSYENTDPSLITKTTFPYSEEGYNQILPYLNQVFEERKSEWKTTLL